MTILYHLTIWHFANLGFFNRPFSCFASWIRMIGGNKVYLRSMLAPTKSHVRYAAQQNKCAKFLSNRDPSLQIMLSFRKPDRLCKCVIVLHTDTWCIICPTKKPGWYCKTIKKKWTTLRQYSIFNYFPFRCFPMPSDCQYFCFSWCTGVVTPKTNMFEWLKYSICWIKCVKHTSWILKTNHCLSYAGINGYNLYQGEGGWDLIQNPASTVLTSPAGSTLQQSAAWCSLKCTELENCQVFTLFVGTCYFRRFSSEVPTRMPQTGGQFAYLYIKDGVIRAC